MAVIAYFIHLFVQILQGTGFYCYRLSTLLAGLLPTLMSSSQMSAQTRAHYRKCYSPQHLQTTSESEPYLLMPWEDDVLTRHAIRSGRMLIMGSGMGRESIAIARKGIDVVGVDANSLAVRAAQHQAKAAGVRARFHEADYQTLPYSPGSFDHALLSATMYSAIPGIAHRQAWVGNLGRLLKPGGLLIFSFTCLPRQFQASRLGVLRRRCSVLLSKLPGANPAYQVGDECPGGHFLHVFQDEAELRKELDGTGVATHELNWNQGFAVVAYPPHS